MKKRLRGGNQEKPWNKEALFQPPTNIPYNMSLPATRTYHQTYGTTVQKLKEILKAVGIKPHYEQARHSSMAEKAFISYLYWKEEHPVKH